MASAEQAEAPEARPIPVEVVPVVKSPWYARHREYTGMIHEARRSRLSFQRPGELVELLVDEGDRVEAGQLIARLDDRHIRARRAQLEAEHAEAAAVLDELIEGPRKETIASVRADLRQLQAVRDDFANKLLRREKLLESNSVSEEEVESYRFELASSNARVDSVARKLDELLAGTRKEQVRAQRARLARLDAALTEIAHDLEDTLLQAPYGGRIAERLVDEGTILSVGTPVAVVVDDQHLEAWVGLPANESAGLVPGETRELSIDGMKLPGKVRSLSPILDEATRTRNVILDLDPADCESALPGQVIRLLVEQRIEEPGYWVPTTALVRGTRGLWSLYAVEESQGRQELTRRDVEVLDTVGNNSFVRGTLQEGDRIVTDGTHRVVVGQEVVVSRTSLADASQR